ncbi:DUF3396 domain-containing protein [Streptomyces canus]|uniref:hypothetical protein n=1 Tax=Streptomyces canus TaxID=58343 RepID=UPI00324364A7
MHVYIEAAFDSAVAVEPGESLIQWFRAAWARLFDGLVAEEASGGQRVLSLASVTQDIDDGPRRFSDINETWGHFEESLAAFPWGAGITVLKDGAELTGLGSVSTYHVLSDASLWRAEVSVPVDPQDAGSCATLVDFLREALEGANPAFGRIELNGTVEETNLDAALRRKKRTSMRESRQFLRGYAWVTVCPAELLARLGGASALEASGAFYRVIPLRAGGALLQASETLAGYSDAVMERVFVALAPVLPEGEPHPDPACPDLRFVPRDAATAR